MTLIHTERPGLSGNGIARQPRNGRKSRSTFETLEGRQFFSTVTSGLAVAAPSGSAKLTGAQLGTAGSYKSSGNTITNVFDGNVATYFDGPGANGNWIGMDFGSPQVISQIQFSPRANFAGRMVGGVFQASNTADFSSGVSTLLTISATPATGVFAATTVSNPNAFEFVRYLAPANSYGNVAELEFDGSAPVPAAIPLAPSTPVVNTTSGAVQLTWTQDPTIVVNSFTIERQGPADAALVPFATVGGTARSFNDTNVAASTIYIYAVIANNATGPSPVSGTATVTTPAPVPNPWMNSDIGTPGKAGSATVSPTGAVTVNGGGADIWNATDQFNFDYQTFTGNGSITTQVTAQTGTNSWAKSGVMLRESANADSRYVLLALTPGNGVTMQARTATHVTPTMNTVTAGKTGVWLQLTRTGNSFSGYVSTDGVTWKLIGTAVINMTNNLLAGLAVTAHDNTKLNTSVFANTTIAPANIAASPWTNVATAPLSRWESENFSFNGKQYVFGGFIDRNRDAATEADVFDPTTNQWTNLTTIPTGGMTHAAVTVVGNIVYFAGGDLGTFNNGKTITSTATVLTFDLTTNTWGSISSLPVAGSCGGIVAIANHLYYFGGLNANDTADVANTWGLDLTNPTAGWVAEAAMPNARNHMGYDTINGLVYAVGGQHLYNSTGGNLSEVDVYNPVTNTWATIAPLPLPISSIECSTIVVNNKLVVVGGQTNGGSDGIYLNTVYEYDPASNKWTQAGNLPEYSQASSVAYIINQLIVTGGTVDNQGGWAQNWTLVDSLIVL